MRKIMINIRRYVILITLSVIWVTPAISILLTATKSRADFFSGMGLFELPEQFHWENFTIALFDANLLLYMRNSLVISVWKVPIGIFVAALAAFAITRLQVKWPRGIFIYFLIGMMVPFQVALVPLNAFFARHGLIDSFLGITYVYIAFGLPFAILVLRGFFNAIPKELDEAAYIDGCTRVKLFFTIILPLAKPAIASLFILDFLATWNEYILASVLIRDRNLQLVTAGLMNFVGQYGTEFGLLAAGVLLSSMPIMAVYLIFQKHFVEGMAGAVKQ
jgi:raffinose/stachyose/melibiose transport system permease protein